MALIESGRLRSFDEFRRAIGNARLGDSIGRNPTDEGKAGSKRSILSDRDGGPLSMVVARANVHGAKLLDVTLNGILVERPDTGTQHLCLDSADTIATFVEEMREFLATSELTESKAFIQSFV